MPTKRTKHQHRKSRFPVMGEISNPMRFYRILRSASIQLDSDDEALPTSRIPLDPDDRKLITLILDCALSQNPYRRKSERLSADRYLIAAAELIENSSPRLSRVERKKNIALIQKSFQKEQSAPARQLLQIVKSSVEPKLKGIDYTDFTFRLQVILRIYDNDMCVKKLLQLISHLDVRAHQLTDFILTCNVQRRNYFEEKRGDDYCDKNHLPALMALKHLHRALTKSGSNSHYLPPIHRARFTF